MYSSYNVVFLAYFQSLLAEQSDDSIIFDPRTLHIWEVGRRDAQKCTPVALTIVGKWWRPSPPCGGDGVVRETRIDVSGHQRTHTDVSVENKIIN